MNVKRLEGIMLNYWVAKSCGLKLQPEAPTPGDCHDHESGYWHPQNYNPATDWAQGGPIVSNEWYVIEDMLSEWFGTGWNTIEAVMTSPLKWFMRAYVASMFGDEVEDLIVLNFPNGPEHEMKRSINRGGTLACI